MLQSVRLQLTEHKDDITIGHLMCTCCRTELNIELTGQTGYQNPHYETEWEVKWHEFHAVRQIYPDLLKKLWNTGILLFQGCPNCQASSELVVLLGSLFDVKLIKRSFKFTDEYICTRCDKSFMSHRYVLPIDGGRYVCSDCLVFD